MKDIHIITLFVNGARHEVVVESRRTLADVLRIDLRLTGTHLGCEHGICGACTVLVDGQPTRACLMFGVQADGVQVTTVEGLADGDAVSDLQESFSRCHGLQCGFCTPGFLMVAEGFLRETPEPTDEEIQEVASSNICRCTGYAGIRDAIRETAAGRLSAREAAPTAASEDTTAQRV